MYLDDIIQHKRQEVKDLLPFKGERNRIIFNGVDYLKEKPFIAEVKKASPSMGDINTDVDIVKQAVSYREGGAGAISVLTDEKYFKGKLEYLQAIADNVDIPVLCKDFIVDERQIENAYTAGADMILLIAAALSTEEITALAIKAGNLNLKVLYEIHGIEEFVKLKNCNPELVGVNARDLTTFQINLSNAMETIGSLKGEYLKVAESGIENIDDVLKLKQSGADAFLIGTALMKADNPTKLLRNFNEVIK